jgi:hypothetical protein
MSLIVYVVAPPKRREAYKRLFALPRAPNTPFAVPSMACVVKSIYLGMATAARMPMMTMTTTNSIIVKPF